MHPPRREVDVAVLVQGREKGDEHRGVRLKSGKEGDALEDARDPEKVVCVIR